MLRVVRLAPFFVIACGGSATPAADESSSSGDESSSGGSTTVMTTVVTTTAESSTTSESEGGDSSESTSSTTGPGELPECHGPIATDLAATFDRSTIGTGDDIDMKEMAMNAAGETVVVGSHTYAATIGDVVLPGSEVATTGFAAKYDAELALVWVQQLPYPATAVAFDATGGITVGSDLDLRRLDGETGDERWAVDRVPFAFAVLDDGDVIMAARTPNFDDEVVRFAAEDGSELWNVTLAHSPDLALPDEIAITDDGGFFWLGEVMGTVHTESGDVTAGGGSTLDETLVRFDADGVALWGRALGELGYIAFPELVLDECGMYLGGHTYEYGDDGFQHFHARLFRLDMAGELIWNADLMLDDFTSEIEAIATDTDGNVLVVGNGQGTIAGKPLGYVGGYIAQLNRDGDMLWAETLGAGTTPAVGVGYLPDGRVRMGAWNYNSILGIQGQTILEDTGIAVADFVVAPK